jgi:hypothetical protein
MVGRRLIYGMSVTEIEKDRFSEAQSAAIVQAVILDFCPQWKVLLKQ